MIDMAVRAILLYPAAASRSWNVACGAMFRIRARVVRVLGSWTASKRRSKQQHTCLLALAVWLGAKKATFICRRVDAHEQAASNNASIILVQYAGCNPRDPTTQSDNRAAYFLLTKEWQISSQQLLPLSSLHDTNPARRWIDPLEERRYLPWNVQSSATVLVDRHVQMLQNAESAHSCWWNGTVCTVDFVSGSTSSRATRHRETERRRQWREGQTTKSRWRVAYWSGSGASKRDKSTRMPHWADSNGTSCTLSTHATWWVGWITGRSVALGRSVCCFFCNVHRIM